jgi:alpha-D-xyloside xylohydrolase
LDAAERRRQHHPRHHCALAAGPSKGWDHGYGILWNNASRRRFDNRFLNALYLSPEVADAVDYYFLYGPEFDGVIAAYRELTGDAPMFGTWDYGFW